MTKVYINISKIKNTSDFDLLTPAMKDYLETYHGKPTFESQIAEMPEETKKVLEQRLEDEALWDTIFMYAPNIPVKIHGYLYDLKAALRLLQEGKGVATDANTGKYKFTYADIQPDWSSKKKIQDTINAAQPALDGNAPEFTPFNSNMVLPDSSLGLPSSAVDSSAPQIPISAKSEEYKFFDGEDDHLDANIPESGGWPLPPSLQFGQPFEREEESRIDSYVEGDNSQNYEQEEAIRLKVVVVGAVASNKMGLLYRYKHGTYPEEGSLSWTRAIDNQTVSVLINESEVLLLLSNVQGQEEYDRLRPLNYPSTDVFILTYSVVDPESFNEIENKWVPELRWHCPDAKIILVGCNMERLVNAVPPITPERVQQVAHRIGAAAYIECSARTGDNVEEVFLTAARIGYEQQIKMAKVAQTQFTPFGLFSSVIDTVRGRNDHPAKHHEPKINSKEELVAELKAYILRRKKEGEQSALSSFLGGTPMVTKTSAARDLINTLQHNAGCKAFSAYSKTTKETLLTGELGEIVNRCPEVAAQIGGEAQLASRAVSRHSSRGNPF